MGKQTEAERKMKKHQYYREYYWRNREQILASVKKWREANPEKRRRYRQKYDKEYYQKTREQRLVSAKKWREAKPEKMRRCKANWRKNHPQSYKISKLRDRYGEAAVQLFLRDGGKCIKCGKIAEGRQSAIHHKDWNPNNNTIENLVTLCKRHHTMIHFFVPVPPETKVEWFNQWINREVLEIA